MASSCSPESSVVTAAAVLAALAAEAPKPLLLAAAFFTFVLAFSSENSLKLTAGFGHQTGTAETACTYVRIQTVHGSNGGSRDTADAYCRMLLVQPC